MLGKRYNTTESGITFCAVTMEMRSLVNTDSEFRASERGLRSVIHALRSICASDLDHSCGLHLLATLPSAVCYMAPLQESQTCSEGLAEFCLPSDHLPVQDIFPSPHLLSLGLALLGSNWLMVQAVSFGRSEKRGVGQERQCVWTGRQFKIGNHGLKENMLAIK